MKPMAPRALGWSSGKTPLPWKVVATGIFSFSENWIRASWARWRAAPCPARMMGVLADSSSLAAWAIWAGAGAAACTGCTGRGRSVRFDRHRFHVLGDGQIDGAGPLGLGQVEGVADHLGGGTWGKQGVGPLGHRLEEAHQVHYLMGLLVDPPQPHLGAEGHQGRAVRLGVGDPEQQVDGPGAEGGEANPRLAGDPAVHLGHEGGALLRAHQDKAEGRIVEGIHQVDDLLAGETENVVYSFVFQAFGDELGDVHYAPV